MAKKLSKKRTTRLIDTTSNIYSRVCSELGFSTEKLLIKLHNESITPEQFQESKEKIDTLYCKYVCELEDEMLQDFLDAHVSGQIRRAQRTLDRIQKELLERVVNEDSQGDSN